MNEKIEYLRTVANGGWHQCTFHSPLLDHPLTVAGRSLKEAEEAMYKILDKALGAGNYICIPVGVGYEQPK